MRREVDKYRQTVDRPRTKETTHHEDLSASTAPGWPYTSGTVVGVPPPEWTRDDHFDHVVGGTDHGRRTKERAYQERHLARGAYLNASVVTGPAMLARVTREVDERFFPKKGTRPRRRGSGGAAVADGAPPTRTGGTRWAGGPSRTRGRSWRDRTRNSSGTGTSRGSGTWGSTGW